MPMHMQCPIPLGISLLQHTYIMPCINTVACRHSQSSYCRWPVLHALVCAVSDICMQLPACKHLET